MFAGRSALRVAAISALVVVALGVYLSPRSWSLDAAMRTVSLLDQCALFGITFFLLLLASVITRYPISIGKNVAIHCYFFGAVLFPQAAFHIVDQWSSSRYTDLCNTMAAAAGAITFTAWTLLVTDAGDEAIIRMRRLDPKDQLQLMGQLDTFNGILLRVGRK